jgi:hypothetical protein
MPGFASNIEFLDYRVRSMQFSVSENEEAPDDVSLSIDFDFLQHEEDPNLYLAVLNVGLNSDVPMNVDVLLRAKATLEGFVRLPEDIAPTVRRLYLVEGTALLYNTFRGTLSSFLACTEARDYVLPSVDFADITIKSDKERAAMRDAARQQKNTYAY